MSKIGKVVQINGPVVDVEFDDEHLPAIYNALRINDPGTETGVPIDIIVEVEQHLGENRVRCVSMEPTDGLLRGLEAEDLGRPIQMPVGEATLGRVLNVVGKPVDERGEVDAEDYIYEPGPRQLFDALLPHYVENQIHHAMLESVAAEHAARMTAMESATNNAGELIDSLTLTMNRLRQASITTEIIEVVSGAEALG